MGRLDKASEGLLLLTNDSQWAARITDPASHLDKTYHVQVDRVADDRLLERSTAGLRMSSGEHLHAKRAHLLRTGDKNSWLEIALDEGKEPADSPAARRVWKFASLRLVRIRSGR